MLLRLSRCHGCIAMSFFKIITDDVYVDSRAKSQLLCLIKPKKYSPEPLKRWIKREISAYDWRANSFFDDRYEWKYHQSQRSVSYIMQILVCSWTLWDFMISESHYKSHDMVHDQIKLPKWHSIVLCNALHSDVVKERRYGTWKLIYQSDVMFGNSFVEVKRFFSFLFLFPVYICHDGYSNAFCVSKGHQQR